MIDTAAVGLVLPTREATVSVRRMLAYAAGIGDLSPAVFDDSLAGFMAHPAFCVSLEWPVVSDTATAAALVPDPQERLRAVHLIQDSSFHRPVRAGDRLTTAGKVTGIWRGSAGTRTACTLVTTDAQGVPVVTSHTVAVYRGVQATGDDHPPMDVAHAMPAPPAAVVPTFEATIDTAPDLPHRYTECAGIWNPIHTERRVARAAGLPDIVVHGTATWALSATALIQGLAAGDPGRLRRLRGRFGALVFPGSRLTLKATTRPDGRGCHVHFSVLTQQGQEAIADGYALLDNSAQISGATV